MKQRWRRQPVFWGCLLLVAGGIAVLPGGVRMGRAEPKPAKPFAVQVIQDVPYYTGRDADPVQHKLDLYLPRGLKNFPVLFWVHGGAWSIGDKTMFGAYPLLGKFWASRGVAMVVPNYRLSPAVVHPEHIRDVARAFAWTHKNIGKYGGRADHLFVCGDSAGGHLCALLATDNKYLKAEGLTIKDIKGAITLSGLFHLPDSGTFFDPMFGNDPQVRRSASPLMHVSSAAPPFLILYADHDLPYCGKPWALEFCQALQDQKIAARTLEVSKRDHLTLFLNASQENDPVALAMQEFLERGVRSQESGARKERVSGQ